MVFNSAHFLSTISGEIIQESEIIESFDLELLFTSILTQLYESAWQKLENDPSLSIYTTKTLSQIADLLNFEWRSTHSQDKGSTLKRQKERQWGVPFQLLLLTSKWRVLKNKL